MINIMKESEVFMNKMANREYSGGKRMLTTNDACAYIGRGKNSARAWLDEIGATRKFGKAVRFDKVIIDRALDTLSEEVKSC